MSIKVDNISKFFQDRKILDSITFEAKAGDIVGVLGPNGAGKSTMMKIITGYYKQNKGNVFICGRNNLDHEIFTKSKTGYLSEENPLYGDMYVVEFLEFICDIHNLKHNESNKMIQLTGLTKEKNKKIKTLSKGFKQRVGIAQALIHNPELIILDEPTSGLDPKQLIEIRNIITQIGKEKTILLSTHIIQEVEAMCNRIIIINEGKIILDKQIEYFKNKLEDVFLELIK